MKKIELINRKGQVIIYVTLAVVVLILFVGLALDSGISYIVKTKLNSAVDAAAIAAGRALSEGGTYAAEQAATKFFHANFPAGYMRAQVTSGPTTNLSQDAQGRWHISVSATAVVPTYFLKIRDMNTFTVSSTAEAIKRDLDMAFVIDTTDSMSGVATQVKRSAKMFVDKFDASSDRMALIHFAYGAVVDNPIRTSARGFDKGNCAPSSTTIDSTICGRINNLNYAVGGFTNFSESFWRSRDQLNTVPVASRSSLRAIVFFTDGSPNSFSATFTHNPGATTYTGVIQTCQNSCTPTGLWDVGRQEQPSPSPWHPGTGIASYINNTLPQYFNCTPGNTNPTADIEFRICPQAARYGGTRGAVACSPVNYANVNRASRNLPEDMAQHARQEGIYVFTLGLGSHLNNGTGADNEPGSRVLRRMANDPSADTYNPSEPEGLYCFAGGTGDELDACYDAIASQLFRFTR